MMRAASLDRDLGLWEPSCRCPLAFVLSRISSLAVVSDCSLTWLLNNSPSLSKVELPWFPGVFLFQKLHFFLSPNILSLSYLCLVSLKEHSSRQLLSIPAYHEYNCLEHHRTRIGLIGFQHRLAVGTQENPGLSEAPLLQEYSEQAYEDN